jgi:DNA-directed RNA polymerase specialized sigma24 family protein
MGFLHDKADADDLTQDIFIQAYQSLPRFKGDRKSSNNCSAECLQATAG